MEWITLFVRHLVLANWVACQWIFHWLVVQYALLVDHTNPSMAAQYSWSINVGWLQSEIILADHPLLIRIFASIHIQDYKPFSISHRKEHAIWWMLSTPIMVMWIHHHLEPCSRFKWGKWEGGIVRSIRLEITQSSLENGGIEQYSQWPKDKQIKVVLLTIRP